MGTVCELNNCKLKIFPGPREHPPPHIHLKGPNTNCRINLATLEVMDGKFHRSDLKEAREWLDVPANYAAAVTEWRRLNERE
jgi:hypothetical protein